MTGDWNPNELLGTHLGSCVLERPIGIGGMGAVYLAQQTRPHRQVAVKVLRPGRTTSPEAWQVFLARFAREADLAAGLDHANIVPIFEFGQEGDVAFLVMPYLADGSLADLLAQRGRLPLADTIASIEQAAAALDYAHQRGLVHRDVKPSNLLLHPDGRLMLADFGIARPADRSAQDTSSQPVFGPTGESNAGANRSETGRPAGTPEYMAPEQIRRGPITPATDIYALGIVTYAMLAGQTPFLDAQTHLTLARQLHESPMPLRSLRPELPSRVDEVIAAALAKDPAERPQSAGAFAQALRQASSRSRPLSSLFGHAARGDGAGDVPRGMLRMAGLLAGPSGVPPQAPRSPIRSSMPSRGSRPSAPRAPYAAPPAPFAPAPFGPIAPPVPRRANGTQPLAPGRAGQSSQMSRVSATSAPGPSTSASMSAPPLPNGAPPSVGMGSQGSGFTGDNSPTIFDAPAFPPGGIPAWPGAGRAPMPPGGRARQRQFSFFKLAAAVSVAVVGFVLLLGGLSQAGLFAAPSLPRAGVPAATFAPTATALPTPTPTIPPNWLRVTPTSIELTCKGKTSKQSLTIRNQGNDSLDWLIEANGFTGLNFSQAYGTIPAGKQTTITVTDANWTWSDINNRFAVAPQDDNAGDPAMVSYTAKGCFFGGEGSHG